MPIIINSLDDKLKIEDHLKSEILKSKTSGDTRLDQWVHFADVQQKLLDHICLNINSISDLTETKTIELSHEFQNLSNGAQEQTKRIAQMIHLAKSITIEGEDIEISEMTRLLQETFINSITCILDMSKKAMVMIYSLNDSIKTLSRIEKSILEIEKINHKTKYLSLNATIEAVRAGEAGESFQVVASEVRDLSNDTQTLAVNIRGQVSELGVTIQDAQDILQSIAKTDLSSNLLAKDQLDNMIAGLIHNSCEMADIMSESMMKSEEFSTQSGKLISEIQYQDRVKEDLGGIINDLKKISSISDQMKNSSLNLDEIDQEKIDLQSSLNETILKDFDNLEMQKILSEGLVNIDNNDDKATLF